MANFPIYHGITLSNNAYVENLVVERLASDPVPVEAGRVWYNTTLKVFRQSTLDGTGAVVVRTFATVEELTASINAETTARTAAVTTLQSNLDAETTARVAGDATLQSNLNTEITARTAADTTLQSNLDTETTARIAGDATLQSNLNAEATARSLADTTLQANIDAVNNLVTALGNAFNYVGAVTGGADADTAYDMALLPTGQKDAGDYFKVTTAGYFKVGTTQPAFYANVGDGLVWNIGGTTDKIDNTDSNVSSGNNDYISVGGSADTGFTVDVAEAFKTRVSTLEGGLNTEITARSAADTTLQANLNTEITARSAADTTLQANIDAEATARAEAVVTLQANINVELTARAAADVTLQANIDAEATARTAADATLQANLNAEITARTAADATLQANLNAEITARTAADATLQANIDAEVTARKAADGDLTTLSTTAKTDLVSAINEVNSLVAGGTADVRSDYNATIFTFDSTSGAAASTYTITHNLNFAFVDVSVFVDRGLGVYFNDIVSVEIVTTNQIKVYLSEAKHVKVIVRSAATI